MDRSLAVVTGASSGIGAATARALAADGWRVVLVARGRAQLEVVEQSITAGGGEAVIEALDASDGAEVLAMADRIRLQHGSPSLIVNSAGMGEWKFIEETPPNEAVAMLAAPYLAAYNTSHAFMPDMLDAASGTLIHVGSPASRLPWPGATSYTAVRWALKGLNEALNQDLAGTGVRSCHVVFGEVSSAYFDTNKVAREHLPKIGRLVPVITPEQCARVVMDVVRRPRREVVYPFMLRVMYWLAAVSPGPTRWLLVRTGRRH
jgi:NADP-dependent 3-hydroxy acid dehydrogenase YdfG